MNHLFLAGLAILSLAGCAGVSSDAYCIEHRHGTATVTATGIETEPGRCTEWQFGPSAAQRAAFAASHGAPK